MPKKGTFDGTSWNLTSQNGIWSAKDFINHNSEFDNHEWGTEAVTPANHLGMSRYHQRCQNGRKEGAKMGFHEQKKSLVSPNKNNVNREILWSQ